MAASRTVYTSSSRLCSHRSPRSSSHLRRLRLLLRWWLGSMRLSKHSQVLPLPARWQEMFSVLSRRETTLARDVEGSLLVLLECQITQVRQFPSRSFVSKVYFPIEHVNQQQHPLADSQLPPFPINPRLNYRLFCTWLSSSASPAVPLRNSSIASASFLRLPPTTFNRLLSSF